MSNDSQRSRLWRCSAMVGVLLSMSMTSVVSQAAALPFSLEVSSGINIPISEQRSAFDQLVGLHFGLGARKALFRHLDGLLTFDMAYTYADFGRVAFVDGSSNRTSGANGTLAGFGRVAFVNGTPNRTSGANRTLFQGALNVGSRFDNKPNVYVGLGFYRASWSDLRRLAYDGWRVGRYDNASGAIAQIGLHFDIILTRFGNFFISGRFVQEIGGPSDGELAYIPATVGFRFK